MKRVYVVLKEDIIDYPPVLSIIRVLSESSFKVIHLGTYSDIAGKGVYEKMGVSFVSMPKYDGNANMLRKFVQQLSFKKKVTDYLEKEKLKDDDRVWLIQSETIYLLSHLVKKYKTICHFLEYSGVDINWKYKIISPTLDIVDTIQHAYKVVCCEYNRAQIAKGLFQLDALPIILPNKMIIDDNAFNAIPEDIKSLLEELKNKTEGKRIILYQGIFLEKERRLEEFCEAVQCLSDDFVFIAMGRGSIMYEELKKKYESDRLLFIPFIRPPYHLLITQLAYIGVLSYFPRKGSIDRTLNPLYCAPNKIFEYSKYRIPMISNDVPALKYTFLQHHCGLCVEYPMSTQQIIDTVDDITKDYDYFQKGAESLYDSVDVYKIINGIVS